MAKRKRIPNAVTFHRIDTVADSQLGPIIWSPFVDDITPAPISWFSPSYSSFFKEWERRMLAVHRQIGAVKQRVSTLEFNQQHSIQPALSKLARYYEVNAEKDAAPPAASVEYEWQLQVTKAHDIVGIMLDKFDELEERLSFYVKLLDQVQELWKLARMLGNRHLRDATLILHDGLAGIYSEDLTIQQAKVIEDAVRQFKDPDWGREMVRALDRRLREGGFETVPSDKFAGQQNERERTHRRTPVS